MSQNSTTCVLRVGLGTGQSCATELYCIIGACRHYHPSTPPDSADAHLANVLQPKAQRVPINVGAEARLLSGQLRSAGQPQLLPLQWGSQSAVASSARCGRQNFCLFHACNCLQTCMLAV